MIIDVHRHTTAPQELYGYNYRLIANRGDFGRGDPRIGDEAIEKALARHLEMLKEYGIDLQLIPPRPWGIPNAETSEKIVQWMAGAVNDLIARQGGSRLAAADIYDKSAADAVRFEEESDSDCDPID